jgi:hypothetical protein
MKYQPAIVAVAYNRPKSLKRLLGSLKNAKNITNTKLIISIDNKYPENIPVKQIADEFNWPFGEKEVIYHEKKLGLRQHILKCGDLTEKYGSVIILEDDLFVSPYFYDYTKQALDFYDNDPNIAGISLFSQPAEDLKEKPFRTIEDDSDVYFLQFASSWGQSWTNKHWSLFRKWLADTPDISHIPISDVLIHYWPESSWKKLYCAYLKDTNKFFVFPRLSLTTNFNEPGTNYKASGNFQGQAPLKIFEFNYRFKNLNESFCVYDAYFELKADTIKHFSSNLKDFDIEIDLYGHKEISKIKLPYILTTKPVKKYIKSFRRALKPHEMNVLMELEGDEIFLAETKDVIETKDSLPKLISDFKYYHTRYMPSKKIILYNSLSKYFKNK